MKGERMQALKIYTAEELELKDFRGRYEEIANYLHDNDIEALDRRTKQKHTDSTS